MRVRLHRFEDVPRPVAVDLVVAAEPVAFAVAADHVSRRQDLQEPAPVLALDHVLPADQGVIENRIHLDDLFRERQVIPRLVAIVREHEAIAVVAGGRLADEAVQSRQREVGRLPILLRSAEQPEVEPQAGRHRPARRRSGRTARADTFDPAEQRGAVDPRQPREQVERRELHQSDSPRPYAEARSGWAGSPCALPATD